MTSILVTTYGADPTGVNDSTTAILQAEAAAVANGSGAFNRVDFPAGIYKFSRLALSPHVEHHAVGNVILLSTVMDGVAITINTSAGDAGIGYKQAVFTGSWQLRPENFSTTGTGIFLGDTGTTYTCAYAIIRNILIQGFAVSHQYGNNAYVITWDNCAFTGRGNTSGSKQGVYQPAALTNTGENLIYSNCLAYEFDNVFNVTNAELEINWIGGSLDYNGMIWANNFSHSIVRFTAPHIEWNNTANQLIGLNGPSITMTDPYLIYTGTSSSAPCMIASVGGLNGAFAIKNPTYNIGQNVPYYYVAESSALLKMGNPVRQFGTNPSIMYVNPGSGAVVVEA